MATCQQAERQDHRCCGVDRVKGRDAAFACGALADEKDGSLEMTAGLGKRPSRRDATDPGGAGFAVGWRKARARERPRKSPADH